MGKRDKRVKPEDGADIKEADDYDEDLFEYDEFFDRDAMHAINVGRGQIYEALKKVSW